MYDVSQAREGKKYVLTVLCYTWFCRFHTNRYFNAYIDIHMYFCRAYTSESQKKKRKKSTQKATNNSNNNSSSDGNNNSQRKYNRVQHSTCIISFYIALRCVSNRNALAGIMMLVVGIECDQYTRSKQKKPKKNKNCVEKERENSPNVI